jgi:GNAT superfamily N-acetyltransferase
MARLPGRLVHKVWQHSHGISQVRKIGAAHFHFTHDYDTNKIMLSDLHTAPRYQGKGHGERAMKALTKYADRHKAEMHLEAHPYVYPHGSERPEDYDHAMSRLKTFYGRHGFTETSDHYMKRNPQ